MNRKILLRIILGVLFIGISANSFCNYLDYKSSIVSSKPISYVFLESRINKGGRGETYEMDFLYKKKKSSILITSSEFNLAYKGKYPVLYVSKKSGDFFSRWSIKRSFRITVLFFIFFILTAVPYSFIFSKLNKRIK